MESLHGQKAVLLEVLCVRTVLYVVGRWSNEILSSIVFIPGFKIPLTWWTAAAVVRPTVIDIAVSNGPGWAVCLSSLSPKDVNESSFRSAFCSEYRIIVKVQEHYGSQRYRQHSLLQFVLWHPVTSAGLLDGIAPSMGDDHREQCLRSRAECWNLRFENLIYDGVKIERGWRLVWTSP